MKVQNVSQENNNTKLQNVQKQQLQTSPSFKAGGLGSALNAVGSLMQGIEDGGFLLSFIIQDGIGMTAPRAWRAFNRDREITGEYNKQEGFEVLGREGLTGPCMMAVAPIMFALAAKFGRTTGMNSQLIKRYGNNLKQFISKPNFDKALLNNKTLFKKEFYTENIREMLNNTVGKENVTDKSIEFILKQINKYENIPADAVMPKNFLGIKSKRKYRKECINEIMEHINSIKYSTSSDLTMLNKVKVGSIGTQDVKAFSTQNAIEGMIKYSDDAITLNKNIAQLDAAQAEEIKNSAFAKRFITNITTIFATLGVLSLLPKLYIRSNISPGARAAMQLREQNKNNEEKNDKNEISFKAKKPDKSFLAKIGKKLAKFLDKDFVAKELEYNGHNFTNTLMAGLSAFGLLTPRGLKAYNRAQVDEYGQKDLTEVYEILIRDLISSLTVVFAVPMLTRAAVTAYENKSGFVLLHKDRNMSKKATIMDLINPYSKAHVMTNAEIHSLYNGIDSQKKMLNFCEYVDKNGGDLEKILSKSKEFKNILKENSINPTDLSTLSKKDKNAKIKALFENFGKGKTEESVNATITKLMKGGVKDAKANKILSFARGLNSVPGLIATFVISPFLLGILIPELTYANTRRIHKQQEEERQRRASKLNTAV